MVSVIIPIYNSELYLKRCIESVLNQTYSELQIILVDDGSSDSSASICDYYAQKDSRVQVIHKENGGVSDARNVGISQAEGEYIGFIDSDDWIHPQYFERLLHVALNTQAEIVVCKRKKVGECNSVAYDVYEQICYNTVCGIENLVRNGELKRSSVGRIYAAKIIGTHTFATGVNRFEDVAFNTEIICSKELKASFLDEELYYIFNNVNSLTHLIRSEGQLYGCIYLYNIYENWGGGSTKNIF